MEFKNVSKRFKDFSLENIDLKIKPGEITGFVGANGAGKSTTMKLMMNLLQPDAGDIKIFGKAYEENEKDIKERIGFVYDSNVFYESLNLKDISKIVGPAYKNWNNKQFYDYIEQFELPLNKPIKTFSKGMLMKTSLALALSHDAEFIMMDEPTAGLDPVFRRELLEILKGLMKDGKRTIFFSTHITSDLEHIADNIVFIQNGKILFNESKNDIEARYALVKGNNDVLNAEVEQNFISLDRTEMEFQAITNNAAEIKNMLGDKVVLEKATLEDIMFYTKGAATQHA